MFSQCASIHWWAVRTAGFRNAPGTRRSSHFSRRSIPRKKFVQVNQRAVRRDGGAPISSEELGDPALGIQPTNRLIKRHDRKRNDDGACPRRHRAQAEVQSRRNQHQLRWNTRALVIADLAQKRQVEPREAVACVRTPASRIACAARAIAGS